MPGEKLSAREKKWRAEDDARTLAQSEVIKDDPTRLVAAKNAARRIAKDEKEHAEAMSHVASIKGGSSRNPLDKRDKTKRKKSPAKKKQRFNVFQKV